MVKVTPNSSVLKENHEKKMPATQYRFHYLRKYEPLYYIHTL